MLDIKKLSVSEIKRYTDHINIDEYEKTMEILLADHRVSVKKLGYTLGKKIKEMEKEEERLGQMLCFERELYAQGIIQIAGVDEAGRGPLAGPVVAAAVILPKDAKIYKINDSKKISAPSREKIFNIIKKEAIGIGVGIIDNGTIDQVNILNASKMAMLEAIDNLSIFPQHVLIDAVKLDNLKMGSTPIIKGDAKSISIAAASIVAKETRDSLMREYHITYPEYGFDKHKGYPTKEHYEKIQEHGITSIHRRSFLSNVL